MISSKGFRNGLVWTILALALLLIVLFVLIATGNPALTGFASKDSKKNQDKQNFSAPPSNETNYNNSGSPFIINVIPPDLSSENQTSNYTNLSSNTTQQTRRRGSGGSHGGGNGNGNGNNPPYYNNSNNQTNGSQTFFRKISFGKFKNNISLKWNGMDITDGEEFQGIVRLNLNNKNDAIISTFDINFTDANASDVNISDIVADSDNISGKAFMHTSSGLLENIDLYVPKKEGINAIVVCPGASSYDEIYYDCANEEILYLNNSRVEVSSDGLYYIVHNITGTGATGVNVTNIISSKQNVTTPGQIEAMAGNITEIDMPGSSGTTQAWAGYYGNVSGTIQLADSSDNVMYNWSLLSPKGEIFASTNNSIVWNQIQCFNFTASGTYANEAGNGGTTNLYGTNLSQLEFQYGIGPNDLDGINETFYLKGPNTHNQFYVNYNQFDEGECSSTRIYDNSGTGTDNSFEEVLMYEPTTYSVVFASLLNENVLGFDNNPHDFEMLVLENGHGTDTSPTTYYFYAAIS